MLPFPRTGTAIAAAALQQQQQQPIRCYAGQIFSHRDTAENNADIPFEFTEENRVKAKEIIARYPDQYKKGACMPLLLMGQEQLGWTSISVMNKVADMLEMPRMRVYEVATFYTMYIRKPIGKYHLQVCTTTPCELCGSGEIVDTVKKHLGIGLGETTEDGLFTLSEVECAGCCVNAPMMAVNYDYYEDLTPETTISVIEAARRGEALARGPQSGRTSCEPKTGLTSLTSPPPKPGDFCRADL